MSRLTELGFALNGSLERGASRLHCRAMTSGLRRSSPSSYACGQSWPLTSRVFTTCRSRPQGGAGMSAPFLIYTFHRLRGKRRVSAALREIQC